MTEADTQTLSAEDLMAQFTVADYTAITAAVAATPAFGLLWHSLHTQSNLIAVSSGRFERGWRALIAILGFDRISKIASKLGLKKFPI
jgi:hypothetical protein